MRRRHFAPLAAFAVLLAQISATPPISDAEFVRRHVAAAGFAWVPETTLGTEGGAWIDVYVEGAQLMPWGFRLDHFARSGPPPALPTETVPADSVAPIVQRWLDWWERHDRWSGTLGIARRDTTLLIRPIGFADRERRIPNAADTRGPHSPAPRGYGLGFQLMEYGGKSSWGHGGGGGRYGIGTQFATFADGSWTVAMMAFLARQP